MGRMVLFAHGNQLFKPGQCRKQRRSGLSARHRKARVGICCRQMPQQTRCQHRVADPAWSDEKNTHGAQAYTRVRGVAPIAAFPKACLKGA